MQRSILFVEDNEDLRDNAALVLDLEGYDVRVARDGQEALEVLDEGFVPNLIVSDIMMPRMDGYAFFEAVRQKNHLKAVPFIFLTARGSRQDISTGRMLGADDYLVKPFDPEEFLIAIENKLRRADEMREQAVESLNEARRVLVQLMSHELRTPLTYVTGGFALLAEELENHQGPIPNDDIRISLDLIQSGTQRLNRLAEQMVLYSEIISGFVAQQLKESGEVLELSFLVADALSLVDNLIREHGITVERDIPYEQPSINVFGLKDLLVTAISETIRNAVQYSCEGAAVQVQVAASDHYGTVTITDQGPGIDTKNQADIWQIMIQSERAQNEQQGAGMGLPIVKGIVDCHGGEVELQSASGEGTRVTLRLPLAAGTEPPQ